MPKGIPRKRYTPEFRQQETIQNELLYLQDFQYMEHFKQELIAYLDYQMRRKAPAFGHRDIRRSSFCENSCCIR